MLESDFAYDVLVERSLFTVTDRSDPGQDDRRRSSIRVCLEGMQALSRDDVFCFGSHCDPWGCG